MGRRKLGRKQEGEGGGEEYNGQEVVRAEDLIN
jgi:hypothetical protein